MPFITQNDADAIDLESLYDKAAEEIGNLEQKLAHSNLMATKETKRLKLLIQYQSEDIDVLKRERRMERDHLQATIKHLKSMIQDQSDEIDRLKWKLAKLNKQVSDLPHCSPTHLLI